MFGAGLREPVQSQCMVFGASFGEPVHGVWFRLAGN